MINRYLIAMGWKNPYGRWDTMEVIVDITAVIGVTIVGYGVAKLIFMYV